MCNREARYTSNKLMWCDSAKRQNFDGTVEHRGKRLNIYYVLDYRDKTDLYPTIPIMHLSAIIAQPLCPPGCCF